MHTPASISGHPIHPMLVPIAIGGFLLSFAFDIVCIATGAPDRWAPLALYTMIGGIIGALLAAIPGLIDLVSLPAGPIRKTALTHMAINLTVVALFILNAFLRIKEGTQNLGAPMFISLAGILLLVASGWLGGKMVFEAGVGVNNAPPG